MYIFFVISNTYAIHKYDLLHLPLKIGLKKLATLVMFGSHRLRLAYVIIPLFIGKEFLYGEFLKITHFENNSNAVRNNGVHIYCIIVCLIFQKYFKNICIVFFLQF